MNLREVMFVHFPYMMVRNLEGLSVFNSFSKDSFYISLCNFLLYWAYLLGFQKWSDTVPYLKDILI